jgi:hypothetical protein
MKNSIKLPTGLSAETITMVNSIIESLPNKLSNKVDIISVYTLAQNYELMLISWKDIKKNKLVDKNGELNKHYPIYKNMSTNIMTILKELGLTSSYKNYFSNKSGEQKTALDTFFEDNEE